MRKMFAVLAAICAVVIGGCELGDSNDGDDVIVNNTGDGEVTVTIGDDNATGQTNRLVILRMQETPAPADEKATTKKEE